MSHIPPIENNSSNDPFWDFTRDYAKERAEEFERKRKRAAELLKRIPGISHEALLIGLMEVALIRWEDAIYAAMLAQISIAIENNQAAIDSINPKIDMALSDRTGKSLRKYFELNDRREGLEKANEALWEKKFELMKHRP